MKHVLCTDSDTTMVLQGETGNVGCSHLISGNTGAPSSHDQVWADGAPTVPLETCVLLLQLVHV